MFGLIQNISIWGGAPKNIVQHFWGPNKSCPTVLGSPKNPFQILLGSEKTFQLFGGLQKSCPKCWGVNKSCPKVLGSKQILPRICWAQKQVFTFWRVPTNLVKKFVVKPVQKFWGPRTSCPEIVGLGNKYLNVLEAPNKFCPIRSGSQQVLSKSFGAPTNPI